MNASPTSGYLIIFFIVILACVLCVAYGVFQLVRYFVTHRHARLETEVEFSRMRARLDAQQPTVGQLPLQTQVRPGGVLQGQELLETEEGKQARALLAVAGIVSMGDRFWVTQEGLVYIFTKSPESTRAPAWLVRVDTEKVEAVPAGVPVEVAVARMNSANSQQKQVDSPASDAD